MGTFGQTWLKTCCVNLLRKKKKKLCRDVGVENTHRRAPTDYSHEHVIQEQGDENNEETQSPRLFLLSDPCEQIKLHERIESPHGVSSQRMDAEPQVLLEGDTQVAVMVSVSFTNPSSPGIMGVSDTVRAAYLGSTRSAAGRRRRRRRRGLSTDWTRCWRHPTFMCIVHDRHAFKLHQIRAQWTW